MPTYTKKLKIPKPLGNEAVTRAKFIEVLDAIESNAASAEEVDGHIIGLVPHLGTTTNVGSAYSITTTEEMPINKKFTITFNTEATGATTLNISTIGTAKAIKKQNGTNLIAKAATYTLFWNGTNFQSLGEGGEYGTVTAADVLVGKTVGTDEGLVSGTMPNLAGDSACLASSIVGTTLKLRPPKGYKDGVDDNVTITDANLLAKNIPLGKTLFGLVGTGFPGIQVDGTNMIELYKDTTTINATNYYSYASYTKIHEYVIPCSGTYRVGFGLLPYNSSTVWGRIYKNGVAYGIERYTHNEYYSGMNFVEDLEFTKGDLLQLYFKNYDSSVASGLITGINLSCTGITIIRNM